MCAQKAKTEVMCKLLLVRLEYEMCDLGHPDGLHVFLHGITNVICFPPFKNIFMTCLKKINNFLVNNLALIYSIYQEWNFLGKNHENMLYDNL